MDDKEKLAKQRFMTLSLVRFGGVAFAIAGAANVGGKLLPDFAPWLGYVLLINAVADFFFIPNMLRKSWERQDSSKP